MAPTGYAGIYADWNLDLDGDSANDDPWDFGANDQYPALKADLNGDNATPPGRSSATRCAVRMPLTAALSGVQQVSLSWPDVTETAWSGSPSYILYRNGEAVTGYDGASLAYTDTGLTAERTYRYRVVLLVNGVEAASSMASVFVGQPRADSDGDGLIEITSLAQLSAVRWDLNGDGLADDDANDSDYNTAFPAQASGNNTCNGGAEGEGACEGYELTADLDFDTAGTADDRTDDAHYNGGAGWEPIGSFVLKCLHRRLRRRRQRHLQPVRQSQQDRLRGPIRLHRQRRRGAAPAAAGSVCQGQRLCWRPGGS